MSVPPGGQWSDFWEPQNNPTTFTYEADDTYGRGQTIYMVEDGINADHPVCIMDEYLPRLRSFDFSVCQLSPSFSIQHSGLLIFLKFILFSFLGSRITESK